MIPSGFISGIVLSLIGLVLLILGILAIIPFFVFVIYGTISLVLGVYMLINSDKEDRIEQIRKK